MPPLAPAVPPLGVPPLDRRVTDLADLFTISAASEMDTRFEYLENDTGAQVAVLTIPSLEGDPLEDFSIRVVVEPPPWRRGWAYALYVLAAGVALAFRLTTSGVEPSVPPVKVPIAVPPRLTTRRRSSHL